MFIKRKKNAITKKLFYTFSLPMTPRNCRIFGYANMLSVPSKFVKTYEVELNADGLMVFSVQFVFDDDEDNDE